LPEIVAAVLGRVPVLFDSGIRNGTDAFKALALGATAVGIGGRPSQWAMGAYGAPGVTRLLEIMKKELTSAMANAGRPTTASLDQSAVKTRFV
jgi:isopentenyl diphosphate isomerase/L-lactate dehydrogenase-like FMN-dependent dehydrogenase